MFLDINKIDPEGFPFDENLRLPDLAGVGRESHPVLEARIHGEAKPGSRGVDLRGRLEAKVSMPCSRCIEPFVVEIDTDVCLTLVPEAVEFAHGEARVEGEDARLFYASEGKADLSIIAVEQIYLNLPQKPICSQECKGLCPECGSNRNADRCDCRIEDVDPRLAPLLELRKDT
jgi:uncharacterized protein